MLYLHLSFIYPLKIQAAKETGAAELSAAAEEAAKQAEEEARLLIF